ncbi:alpha/beta hydrolase family protein [Clostridium cellulovorans]|uniref:Putative cinnamoyl ester hydrolase n=1 Tax=Clostridium cellulovorans (strain ATCC 35296 / DSM 3052 / OCM 3 / 743B) TaxID=573061 RepID=D9SX63_CLOC7|nr:alpha/beta fold hydrolase [Clostridium cellulovorans]ADL53366.1 putative cinnamoyl ester hydrolase [Clostridium cellulovorans 743B]
MKTVTVLISHHERELHGNFVMPEQVGKYPVVIYSHGYNGVGEDFKKNAEYLAQNGIGAFYYDFCGGSVRSKSSMKTTEMTIFTEKEDLQAVLSILKKQENVDADNIFVFGASQGGFVTTLVAEECADDIRGMVLLFPALCIADNWNERFPNTEDIPNSEDLWGMTLGKRFFETLRGFDIFTHIGKYQRNILIMHGDQDEIVPLEYSQRLRKVYSNVKIEVFQGEAHGFSEVGNQRVGEMTLGFVLQNKKV